MDEGPSGGEMLNWSQSSRGPFVRQSAPAGGNEQNDERSPLTASKAASGESWKWHAGSSSVWLQSALFTSQVLGSIVVSGGFGRPSILIYIPIMLHQDGGGGGAAAKSFSDNRKQSLRAGMAAGLRDYCVRHHSVP